MLDFSFGVSPNTEKLRSKLNAPFSAIFSPAEKAEIPFIDVPFTEFPRCPKCKAYISNNCVQDEKGWTCSICGTHCAENLCNFLPEGDNAECRVDDAIDAPVLVIYLDLGFHESDIKAMIPSIVAFLRTLRNERIIIMIGTHGAECAFLCPHKSHFAMTDDSLHCILSNEEGNEFASLPAPLMKLAEFPEDVSRFIFTPEQIPSAILSIEKLTACHRMPFRVAASAALKISNALPKSPVHFIGVVSEISYIHDSFKSCYESYLCMDILTPTFLGDTEKVADMLPGRALFFDADTLLNMLTFCTKEEPSYQAIMFCRAKNAKVEFRPLPNPPQYLSKGVLYVPVITNKRNPFVLDIHPTCTSKCEEIILQVTSKMARYDPEKKVYKAYLRILNRKISTSDNIDKILESINPNALMWLWVSRTLQKPPRDVIAALFRVVARFVNMLPRDSEASNVLIDECCTLKFAGFTSDNAKTRFIGKNIICNIPPSELTMKPVLYENEKTNKKTAVSLIGVFSEDKEDEIAIQEAARIGFIPRIVTPIPEWCLETDSTSLDFLESLLND